MITSQQNEIDDKRVTILKPKLTDFTIFSLQKKHYEPIIQSGRDAALLFLENKS